jgi:hypothetical protein
MIEEKIMKTYRVLAFIAAVLMTACTFEMISNEKFVAQRQQTSSAAPTAAAAAARSPGL